MLGRWVMEDVQLLYLTAMYVLRCTKLSLNVDGNIVRPSIPKVLRGHLHSGDSLSLCRKVYERTEEAHFMLPSVYLVGELECCGCVMAARYKDTAQVL